MKRHDIEAWIERAIAELDGEVFDIGDGVGWIDPDGRAWRITVDLVGEPWCELRIILPPDGKYGSTEALARNIADQCDFTVSDWCEWSRPDGAMMLMAPVPAAPRRAAEATDE